MASAFNLTAQLNLAGPSNVNVVVSSIKKQLGNISANVNVNINPAAAANVSKLNASLNALNKTLASTKTNASAASTAISQFGAAVSKVGNSTNNISVNIKAAAQATNQLQNSASQATQPLQKASTEMQEFGKQSALAIRRFAAFSVVSGLIFSVTNAISKGVAAFIEYDKEFVKLQQVTGDSATALSGLASKITKLSVELGVSSGELTKVSSTLAQAGLNARDTEKALKALALSALAPSFDDMNKTVEGSIALMRQFNISASDLEQSLGAVNAVAAKFAVESSDIIAAIQRTGGVFASASKGVSEGKQALNEFIAVFTSVRATTRESAETIATGLRTIFTRIQRGGTIEALKEFGVNLTDAQGKFVGAYKAIELLSKGLNSIDPRDLKFSQIVEELGGFRQIGKVIPLIQQFATAQDALKVAQEGQTSLTADSIKAQLSLANQISKVREEFLALFREIGKSESFQVMVRGALSLSSTLIKLADSVKGVLPVLGLMLAFKGTSAVSQFATGFVGGLRKTAKTAANGGIIRRYASGGPVDVALMPGETVVYPETVKKIGASKLRQMNYADKRTKMAQGGMAIVPGSGNTDSFYTTLPEGSFVIRKDASTALGLNRQKYAKGDKVINSSEYEQSISNLRNDDNSILNQQSVGIAILKGPKTPLKNSSVDKRQIIKSVGKKYSDLLGASISGSINIEKEALSPKVYELFNNSIENALVTAVNTAVGSLTKSFPKLPVPAINGKEERDKYLKGVNDAAKGNIFEEILTSMRNKGKYDTDPDPQRPFDFSPTKESPKFELEDLFTNLSNLSYVDAKASNPSDANIAKKIANQTLRELGVIKGRRKKDVSINPSEISADLKNKVLSALQTVDPNQGLRLSDLREKTGLNKELTSAQLEAMKAAGIIQKQFNKYSTVKKAATGGLIQKFAQGSSTPIRNLGYIDGDVLNDPANADIVRKEMERLGIKDILKYKAHLSTLSAARRKSGDLGRLTTIHGAAGSGKSTFVQGGSRASEADNARLRRTNRYPILTEADVLRSNQVIDSTSVAGPGQKDTLIQSDRVINLSSRTKESQEVLTNNRKSRDLTGKGLFGRKPGSTKSATLDSGPGEAYIAANVDSKKVRTLKIGPNFTKTRTNQPTVRSPEKIGLFYGNFGPTTAGHLSVVDQAKKMGIKPEDFVALVGGDTPIDYATANEHDKRTVIFPQTSKTGPSRLGMARATFGALGANVAAMPKGSGPGSIPSAFKIGDDSYIVPRGKSDVAFVGDEKNEGSLDKYTKLGYTTKSLPRAGGISGTAAREAIMQNDIAAMKKLLSPEGIAYVQQHLETIQRRPGLLDSILQKFQQNSELGKGVAGKLSSVKAQLAELPSRKTKTTPPEIVAKMESLRKERDSLESKIGRRPSRLLARLESMSSKAYGGLIQKFANGGLANYYDLEKSSGLKKYEFDNAVKFAKMANYSMVEFQSYLKKLQEEKKRKEGVKTDTSALLKSMMPTSPSATSRQLSLAEQLKGPADAGYRPILTEAQRVAAHRESVRKSALQDLKGFAAGGEVPILAQEGEFVVNKNSAKAIGYSNLKKLNKYHSGGVVGKYAAGDTVYPDKGNDPRKSKNSVADLTTAMMADAKAMGMSLHEMMTDLNDYFDSIVKDEMSKGKTKGQAEAVAARESALYQKQNVITKSGGTAESKAFGASVTMDPATGKLTRQSAQNLAEEQRRMMDFKPIRQADKNAGKLGIDANDLIKATAKIHLVFGQLESDLDNLTNAGKKAGQAKLAELGGKEGIEESATKAGKNARKAARTNAKKLGTTLTKDQLDDIQQQATDSIRRDSYKQVKNASKNAQNKADAKLTAAGIAVTDASGKRLNKDQIQKNADTFFSKEVQKTEQNKEQLIFQRTDQLKQNNTGGFLGIGKKTDAQIMAQATAEVEKILQIEMQRAAEVNKQLSGEKSKTAAVLEQQKATKAIVAKMQQDAKQANRGILSKATGAAGNALAGSWEATREKYGFGPSKGAITKQLAATGLSGDALNSAVKDKIAQNRQERADRRQQGGGISGKLGNAAIGLSLAVPGAVSLLNGGEPKTAEAAGRKAQNEALGTTIGSSIALASTGGPIGIIAGLATAAGGIASSFSAAENAANDFAKNDAATKLQDSTENLGKIFDELNKNGGATPALLERMNKELAAGSVAALNFAEKASVKKASVVQDFIGSALGLETPGDKQGANNRSQILADKGIFDYLKASLNKNTEINMVREGIPEKAAERSKNFAVQAQNINGAFEQQVKTGKSKEDIMSSPEFAKQAEILARSNVEAEKQIMMVETDSRLSENERSARKANIVAAYGNAAALKSINAAKAKLELDNLAKSTKNLAFSLKRMFNNMDSAVKASADALKSTTDNLNNSLEAITGNAKVGGATGIDKQIQVLQNPRAYSGAENKDAISGASALFGSQSKNMEKLLQIGPDIENSLMSTINNTLKSNPEANNEEIGSKVEVAISRKLKDLKFPPEIGNKLGSQIRGAVTQMRTKGDEKIDFSELMEKIPELGQSIESVKGASDEAVKALQFMKNSFDELAAATNKMIEIEVDTNSKLRQAQNILAQGSMNLDRALGKDIKLPTIKSDIDRQTRSLTGGATTPGAIKGNIRDLNNQRVQQEAGLQQAQKSMDFKAVEDFSAGLIKTNTALRENQAALKQMADSGELASAALDRVNKVQQKQAAGASILEKIVTSTPKEIANMNAAFNRLSNNSKGIANIGTNANQRKESLEVFNMLLPFLGDKQGATKANILESQLRESGVQKNPFIQQVLDSLRNPESDPEMKAATDTYREAIKVQAEANQALAALNTDLAPNIAKETADAIKTALQGVTLKFEAAQASDQGANINSVPKSSGGIIYRAAGGFAPKGTDTVPAMLTPGEFVVNRSATSANLPLLKSINSGSYSSGGQVRYYSGGGYVSNAIDSNNKDIKKEDVKLSNENLPIIPSSLVKSIINNAEKHYFLANPASFYGSYGSKKNISENAYKKMLENIENFEKISNSSQGIDELTKPDYSVDLTPDSWKLGLAGKISSVYEPFTIEPGWLWGTKKLKGSKFPKFSHMALPGGEGNGNSVVLGTMPFDLKNLDSSVTTSLGNKGRLNSKFLPNLTKQIDSKGYSDSDYNSDALSIPGQISIAEAIIKQLTGVDSAKLEDISKKMVDSTKDAPKEYSSGAISGNKQTLGSLGNNRLFEPFVRITDKFMNLTLSTSEKSKGLKTSNDLALTNVDRGNFTGLSKKVQDLTSAGNYGLGADSTPVVVPNDLTSEDSFDTAKLSSINSQINTIKTNLNKNIQILKDRADIKNFGTISESTGNASKLNTILGNIYEGKFNGLSTTIPQDLLKEDWKNKAQNGGLRVYREEVTKMWKDRIVSFYKDREEATREHIYQLNGDDNPFDISEILDNTGEEYNMQNEKHFAWSSFNVDDQLSDVKKQVENKNKSVFNIGPRIDNIFETKLNKNKLAPSANDELIKGVFTSQEVNIPRLDPKNQFSQPDPNDMLKGFIISASANGNLLNPFMYKSADKDKNWFSAKTIEEIKQELSQAYTSDNQGNPATNNFQTEEKLEAKILEVAKLGGSLNWIPEKDRDKAFYETSNAGVLDTVNELGVFKTKVAQEAGGKAKTSVSGQTADYDKVFGSNKLKFAQKMLDKILLPHLGVLGKLGPISKLTEASQFETYSKGLGELQNALGKKIVRKLPNGSMALISKAFGDIWGKVGAASEVIGALSSNNSEIMNSQLSNILGVSKDSFKDADISYEDITNELNGSIGATLNKTVGKTVRNINKTTAGNYGSIFNAIISRAKVLTERGLATLNISQILDQNISDKDQAAIDAALKDAKGVKEASIDPETGDITYLDSKSTPKNIKDLGKLALNPYGIFPADTRKALITTLLSSINSNKAGTKNNQKVIDGIGSLKDWYYKQDTYLSSGDETVLKDADKLYTKTNEALQLISGGTWKQLPDVNKLKDIKAKLDEMNKNKLQTAGAAPAVGGTAPTSTTPTGKQHGGVVYASTGAHINFQPKGTDTVPAMLTPGEFVVNRTATSANLPLLKSINSGNYNNGGMVTPKYLSTGGVLSGASSAVSSYLKLDQSTQSILTSFTARFEQTVKNLTANPITIHGLDAIATFTKNIDAMTKQLASLDIAPKIEINATHEVNINLKDGASILSAIDEKVANAVVTEVGKRINEINKNNEGQLGNFRLNKPMGK
jgi:Phage-related minor tail protein